MSGAAAFIPSRAFSIVLLAALAGEFLVPLALARSWPSYDARMQAMSVLGSPSSPTGRIYCAWLICFGAVMIGCALMQYRLLHSAPRGIAVTAAALIAAFGIGSCILAGAFPCAESKSATDLATRVHGIASAVGFMALLAVPPLKAFAALREGNHAAALVYAICSILALGFFILFIMADKPFAKGTPIEWEGWWERLYLLVAYTPLSLDAAITLLA